MKKEIIDQIQKKVIKLLRKNSNKPLYISSEDNCSEIARLVGIWIMEKLPQTKIHILKDTDVLHTKKCHDILAVKCDGKINLFDPTIWQFFKNKKSIFIVKTNNLSEALAVAKKIYHGEWKISELLDANKYDKIKLLETVDSNI
ncbi:hypothetical protein A3F08_00085 [Candidatus Berkelbacteria bacterium RIFCSPHIGHO2_12_FULL_36_9]|uniref:Uncharacterized protein n=1 Tax=Candidatus Berkelbacteria bacterium RIFCSPHIGHO2_12_FULL_36_9 TaxID=1797469 RepID=A0A1F5EES8_9BACT|nr:MAG: hypothetical protein A3F08_00085 [Candidatus Berkelbacteria bacterium RIFCSPHIGHO2_12_FULL_36_9]